MKNNQEKRQDRRKQTAEDFTPAKLVNEMLDKLPEDMFQKSDKTFCDPACGNGNMLVEVLKRKLKNNHNPLEAIKTIYGVDIMKDNIFECRLRLLKLISQYTPINEEHVRSVFNNIVWVCIKRHPNGSLDYDFKFKNKASMKDIRSWMDNMQNWMDKVDIDNGIFDNGSTNMSEVGENLVQPEDGDGELFYPLF